MIFIVIIFSIIIGSFLNTVIYRLPLMLNNNNINLIKPKRSFCPQCKHQLNILDLIPVLSYIFLKGKCRYCKQKLNKQYIYVEIISAITSVIITYIVGFKFELIYFLILNYALIVLFFIDYRHQLLPDIITLPLLWIGLFYNLNFGNLHSSVLGAILAYLSLYIIFWIFKIIKKVDAMGYGDFKLFAVFGAWFGFKILAPLMVIASSIAIIFYLLKIKNSKQYFAFAPALITALPIALLLQL